MIGHTRKIDIDSITNYEFGFSEDFPISKESFFNSDVWDFKDNTLARQNSVPNARLQIDWNKFRADKTVDSEQLFILPEQIINELKIFTCLKLFVDGAIDGRKSAKPQTVTVDIKILARFFSAVYMDSLISLKAHIGRVSHISSVTDISLNDINETLKTYSFKDGRVLKKGLKGMTSPIVARYFGSGVKWTSIDIETLDLKFDKKRIDYNPVMPNDLFKFLSASACGEIKGFLNWLNIKSADIAPVNVPAHKVFESPSTGNVIFDDYVKIRALDREITAKLNKKAHFGTLLLRREFTKNHDVSLQDVLSFIYKVQRAAYTIIGMYTGARFSDLTTIRLGCIVKEHGVYLLKGTHVKGQNDYSPEGVDVWPAIPIMRDALRCLEEISRVTFNPYLISSRETLAVGTEPTALTNTGFTGAINNYLKEIDKSGRWSNWKITPHQLRHSLANQLARADVGLIFIASQLKHLHTALNAIPPSITLMYGNIADISSDRARKTTNAHFEAVSNLYDPDSPVAGGGAKEYSERRKVYFEGLAAQGWSKIEIMEYLAKQGLPYASVGIGYCGGRRDRLLNDGSQETSPCIGSLQCNPGKCSQAIITPTHIPHWERLYKHNLSMASHESFAHARDVHIAAAAEAKRVLKDLGVQVE